MKIGETLQFRKIKEIRPEYRGAKIKVKELNYNGTAYHSGIVDGNGFETLFHPNDVKAVNP